MIMNARKLLLSLVSVLIVLYPLLDGCVSGPGPKDIKQSEIQYDLGVNDLRTGQVTDALKEFLEAVDLNPDFPEAQNALGLTYHLLGDHERALLHLQRALDLRPEYSEVRNNLARVHISMGKYREAIPLLNQALEDVFLKERYLAESNLGWALFNIGQEEEAIRHVRNALALNDQFCVGYEYLGLIYKSRKKYEEAIQEFSELTRRCPQHLAGFRNLGSVQLMAGDLEKGCKAIDTCRAASRMTDLGEECERLFRENCPKDRGEPKPSGQQ